MPEQGGLCASADDGQNAALDRVQKPYGWRGSARDCRRFVDPEARPGSPETSASTRSLAGRLRAPRRGFGVVNIFTESGNTGAPYLVASPDVEVVSYTGSSPVGRMIAAAGAPTLKRMNLELGGKTPMIVFDDADLDATVPLLVAAVTTFAGQFCMTGSRILVQRGVADEVRTRLAAIFESVCVGDGLEPDTDMGPMIDKVAVARVDGMVEAALAYSKPIVRGGPVVDGALVAGAFYRPALLEVEDVNSEIVQKEVFGPVATFEVFETEADAIWRANATEMGLAAGIFTNDINISRRVSREIEAGTIWTNGWAAINDGFAEGGYKQSGVGRLRGPARDHGVPGGQDRRALHSADRRRVTCPPARLMWSTSGCRTYSTLRS
jgi:betaine-aldehyde dehydrogenase